MMLCSSLWKRKTICMLELFLKWALFVQQSLQRIEKYFQFINAVLYFFYILCFLPLLLSITVDWMWMCAYRDRHRHRIFMFMRMEFTGYLIKWRVAALIWNHIEHKIRKQAQIEMVYLNVICFCLRWRAK